MTKALLIFAAAVALLVAAMWFVPVRPNDGDTPASIAPQVSPPLPGWPAWRGRRIKP